MVQTQRSTIYHLQGVIIIQFTIAVTIIILLDGITCHIGRVNSVRHALGHYHSVT